MFFFNKDKKLLNAAEVTIEELNTELGQTKLLLTENMESLASEKVVKEELIAKYEPILNLDAELANRQKEIDTAKFTFDELSKKYQHALTVYSDLERQVNLLKDSLEIGEFGLYQPQFSFEFPEQYKLQLEYTYEQQRQFVTSDRAVRCFTEWTVGGSAAEGRKMTKQYSKLMLYAFNGECDALIAKVRWNNVSKTETRIRHTFTAINKLGTSHNIGITLEYLDLKLKELALTYEYEQKKYEEKEEQRRIREQMREEEKVQKEFERAKREAEDEEVKYEKALERAKTELRASMIDAQEVDRLNEKIRLLEINLQEAHERKERAISLAQMTKVGHIYVISNIGSFGENVYKIGMTRRLDPNDRIRELGDASVPFHFDVHAIIYSENAPQLEYELHQNFKDRRINMINQRKEFFRVALDEIELFVNTHANAEIEFTKLAEAKEYRETMTTIEILGNAINNV
jgi:hypothetical protein